MSLLRWRRRAVLVGTGAPRRKKRDLWLARARFSALVIAAVLGTVLALRHARREAARRSALVDIEQIAAASRAFRQDFGRCPHGPDELAVPPGGGTRYVARPPRDPWGRRYFYRCPGRWREDDVDVASPGPNGRWGGGDDITTDL